MGNLTPSNIMVIFLSLGILLGVARLFGDLAQRFNQPSVLGELCAGVLLGPTVFGRIAPDYSEFLFPLRGTNAIALETITTLAIVLFLLVAGMEVDLSSIWRQGKVAIRMSIAGLVIPFFLGLVAGWFAPQALGRHLDADPVAFALFFATALSISALPVIAKTLMDMEIYRSDLGMVVISAAIFNDIFGWIAFAVILGLMGATPEHSISLTVILTIVFAASVITIGRVLIHKVLPFFQTYTRNPGSVLGFALTLTLLGAAFTEWIGIHAIFGAFLVGVAVGDSPHLRKHTRVTIEHFVSSIFAPVFFASIGLKVNFLTHFDFCIVVTVLLIACIGKLAGGTIGARWGGISKRESWAVGFAMNSRGAMEIVLGMMALEAGVIRQRLFVALVIMAIVTSMISGPMMQFILRNKKRWRLKDVLSHKLFIPELKSTSSKEAIQDMVLFISRTLGLDAKALESAVLAREDTLGTGIGNGVAIPHARIEGLREPLMAIGFSSLGIDFDAPDNKLAQIVFLILTPADDPSTQLDLISDIARLFNDQNNVKRVLMSKNFVDFLELISDNPDN